MRKIMVDCKLCGEELPIDRAKEALFQTGNNTYRLFDLCSGCLDGQLRVAETVNDTAGYRKKAAVLIRLPGTKIPEPAGA